MRPPTNPLGKKKIHNIRAARRLQAARDGFFHPNPKTENCPKGQIRQNHELRKSGPIHNRRALAVEPRGLSNIKILLKKF
jgi:hypothetical protein